MRKTLAATLLLALPCQGLFPNVISFEKTYTGIQFTLPIAAAYPPDGTNRLFLVEQGGRILILPEDRNTTSYKVFLDISGRDMIGHAFEEGLLGLAFHPKFNENGKFYIYYSHQHPKRSIISEMRVFGNNPDRANLSSERKLLEIPQPFWNHNSGNLTFGPDGKLYITVGDGGKKDDIRRLAQNPFILNGSVLRIDVDSQSEGLQYGIPEDNPFVNEEGMAPEIWAMGLRNPWGIDYDHQSGIFWLADVGQNKKEEVNHIRKGGNYGWSYREGDEKFEIRTDPPPDGLQFVEPVAVYGRPEGTSITGGVVYYGKTFPTLRGHFLYGDWGTGHIWATDKEGTSKMVFRNNETGNPKQFIFKPVAFVSAPDGEVLVLSWNGGMFQMVKSPLS